MIETRDTDDLRGQQRVAAKILDGLRAEGRWPAVYIDDMQKGARPLRSRLTARKTISASRR
jgi:hypothetical protein